MANLEVKKDRGLMTGTLPVEKFIKLNSLKEVTSPIYLDRGVPTANGVLSYEIFGTAQDDRKNRMAYINLYTHYMYPLAATKLASYDRTLSEILYGRSKWKLLTTGEVVEDPDGSGGPEFLYSIWGKVKVRSKTTVTTKEIETFFQQSRDELFTTQFPVIPPFTRDLNVQTNTSSKSSNILNSMYSSMIAYTQSLQQYTDTFTNMTQITQGRIQKLMVDIYTYLMIDNVKGSPSKFGLLRRFAMGKNLPYTARLVQTAPVLNKDSVNDVQVKFGYALLPLTYVLSCFFPFMVHYLKNYFDANFIQPGKAEMIDKAGKKHFVTFTESFDENTITKMINRYINSPSSRFDEVLSPVAEDGNRYAMTITGRFMKNNTTFVRRATLTDVLYIVAKRVVENKHVFVTRYPLDNYNGQFPAKIEISTTVKTEPVIIGTDTYRFFPTIAGDPANAFMDTMQFSNTYLGPMNGDYDGDQISVKPVWTKESNDDCEKRINSNAYLLNVQGKLLREIGKDFILCAYNLTKTTKVKDYMQDINQTTSKYSI